MSCSVINVIPYKDYQLFIQFSTNEWRIFDVKPYLNKGIFVQLKELDIFNSVIAKDDSIQWCNEADFCPDCLYIESILVTDNQLDLLLKSQNPQ